MGRWYLLTCVILTPYLVSGQTTLKYGVYEKMLHLNPGITDPPRNMLWKHNGNKVVEFDGSQEEAFSQFQNRVSLDWVSAELNITDLRYDDSGEYELEAIMKTEIKTFKYKVLVIDKISKPIISCDINNGSPGTHGTQATLTCSADSQYSVTYEWDLDGKIRQGPKLTISLGEEHDDQMHTCTVTNPLNSESVTFTAKDCYPAKISPAVLGAGIAVPLIVVLLAVVLGLLCLIQKKKAKGKGKDIEASQGEERKILIDRTPTIPSTQQLHNLNRGHGNMTMGHSDDIAEMEKEGFVKDMEMFEAKAENKEKGALSPTAKKLIVHPPSKNKDDAEADEHIRETPENMVPEYEPSDTKKANEPEPAGGSDHTEDTESAPEHPEEHLDKDKTTCPPSPPKKPARLNPVNQPVNNNDAEKEESGAPQESMVPECEPSDTEKTDEPEPAGGSDHSEDTEDDEELPTAPQRGYVMRISRRFDKRAADGLDHNEDTKDDVVPSTASENPEKHLDKDKKTCPSPPPNKSSHLDPLNQPGNNKENAEKDESTGPSENKVPECEPSDTEEANQSDTQADVELSTAPQPLGYVMRVSRRFGKQTVLEKEHKTTVSQHPSENKVTECEPSDTEKAKESDPPGGLDRRDDTQAEVESSTAPEQPESDKSRPANGTPPVPKPRSRSTNDSPNVGTKDTTGEHKEGTKSHPVN